MGLCNLSLIHSQLFSVILLHSAFIARCHNLYSLSNLVKRTFIRLEYAEMITGEVLYKYSALLFTHFKLTLTKVFNMI